MVIETTLRDNEQQLQAIFDSAPDAVIVMSDEGLVEKWNAKAERTFGWNEEEVLNKPLHQFIIPERYRKAHVEGLKRFLNTGAGPVLNTTIEITALRRDGKEIEVSLSIAPTLVQGRQLFTGFVRDLSEHKSTERHLAAAEERFKLLVASVKDYAIFMLEPDGTIASWNTGAQRIKQYTADEIIGKHFSIFYTEEDKRRNHPQNELKEAIATGKYEEEGWRVRKDGSRFWANVIITSMYDDKNQLRGFSKVTRDMTERMLAANRLEDAIQELERSNKELTSFSYAASHDLQEPLRKIQTMGTRILAKDADSLSESSRDLFSRMIASAARMQQLIDDLLMYSQVGNVAKDFEQVNLNDVVNELIQIHKGLGGEQVKINVGPLPEIRANKIQMRQLFDNLISNSIKYSKPNTPAIINITSTIEEHVQPETQSAKRYHAISVSDNGIGFEPEFSQRIFQMFQRLHGKSEYPGTGIGLSICRKIAENHNGYIQAESAPDVGTTITVYLPE